MPAWLGTLSLAAWTGQITLLAVCSAQEVWVPVTNCAVASTLPWEPQLINTESRSWIIFKDVQVDKYTFYLLDRFRRWKGWSPAEASMQWHSVKGALSSLSPPKDSSPRCSSHEQSTGRFQSRLHKTFSWQRSTGLCSEPSFYVMFGFIVPFWS